MKNNRCKRSQADILRRFCVSSDEKRNSINKLYDLSDKSENITSCHLVVDLYGCNPDIINDLSSIEKLTIKAAKNSDQTILKIATYQFKPEGVSICALLAESHISFHTWPKLNTVTLDIYTCNNRAWDAIPVILDILKPKETEIIEITRGSNMELVNPEWTYENIAPDTLAVFKGCKILFEKSTQFQNVKIVEHKQFNKILILDSILQFSTADEHVYHESLVHPTMLSHSNPKNVTIIGGGDGGTAREVLKHPTVETLKIVEIDPDIINICKEWFPEVHQGAFYDPRVSIINADGKDFLSNLKNCDVLIFDLTNPQTSLAHNMYSEETFKLMKKALNSSGIIAISCCAGGLFPDPIRDKIINELKSSFKNVCPYTQWIPSYCKLWTFCVSSDQIDLYGQTNEHLQSLIKQRDIKNKFYSSENHLIIKGDPFVKL